MSDFGRLTETGCPGRAEKAREEKEKGKPDGLPDADL
jgi:hypothetical protein